MKILVDTNIIFSAILNEKSSVAKTLFYANKKHELYLSTYNIQEIKEVIERKIPHVCLLLISVLWKIFNININCNTPSPSDTL